MKKGRIKHIVTAIAMFMATLYSFQTKADTDYLKILSPLQDAKVKDGELFIAVQLLDSETFKKTSVRLMLDDVVINFQAKVTDRKVTMLYLDHLGAGKHHLKMNAQTSDGGQLAVLEWDFFIIRTLSDSAKMQSNAPEQLKKDYDITGFLSIATRIDTATGPGKALRQSPAANHEVSFNLEPRIKSVSFPMSGYWTNTDNAYVQPRSKYRVGIKTNWLELYYGDHFPGYDPVVLSGVRVHGVEGTIKFRRMTISTVYGDLTRAIDGTILKVKKDTAFVPFNVKTDSLRNPYYTVLSPGTYTRKMFAARINAGSEKEGSMFGITIMKSFDDTNSIKYGLSPKQNIAFGLDQTLLTQNGIFRESSGFAMSMTTNDYSRKAFTREELDTNLKQNLSINPSYFKNLIIINPSTEPLLFQKLSSATWFVKSSLKLWFNRFAFDYHRVGPAYTSFGNPFMRNDIQEVSIADNLNFWKRRIGIQLKAATNENNLYNQLTNRVVNNYYIASLSITPGPKSPQFFGSYKVNDRITTSYIESFYKITDKLINYNAGVNYRIPEGKGATNFNVMYSGTVRNNTSMPDNNSTSDVIFATIQQALSIPFIFAINYSTYNTVTTKGGTLQRMNAYGGSVGYTFKKPKITISTGYNTNRNEATLYTPTANARNTFLFQYREEITTHINFSFEIGNSMYRDDNPNNKYNDYYGMANLNFIL